MDPVLFIYAFCATFFLALIAWGFQIYVSRQLSKAGEKMPLPIGKSSWLTPFVLGWQYAKQLGMTEIMIAWSIVLGAIFISGIVLVLMVVACRPAK